ncbi:hypothetical protein GYO_3819 [Bacillus spizizenii TU-B-10]|uniref:Uncharacterized protein n=1 Tax=Bacillus spizizenii (strain DSM 15029 / JCM 12233 / NBRC 101239 / NRRL B-23049 / TU-B-10) TaxID=1052585 RepID=G4P162_BACS4|nr:hypothetical protein GYO_3819 [Bacillus spizizenii TU-B-10]
MFPPVSAFRKVKWHSKRMIFTLSQSYQWRETFSVYFCRDENKNLPLIV